MRIPIDREQATPLYEQIAAFLRQSILSGSLAPETRLPATRQLAQDLGVSRITVENAYAALESDGLVARRAGSGTHVLPQDLLLPRQSGGSMEWPLWQRDALDAVQFTQAATGEDGDTVHPNLISFTGFGDPRMFPIAEFLKALKDVIYRDGYACMEFGDMRGYPPLRATIAHVLASQGVQTHPDNILITSGSQQALALIAQALLKPGDTVLVESPTYDGALDLFRAHQLKLIGCPADAHGMQVEQLEPLLQQHHPKLIYTIPNFQNPSGACLSLARRRQLIALAGRYNIPLLEDDFVGELRYEGRVQPALKALDPGGRVMYVGTFSKLLMPGLRIGFVVAEGPIYERLVQLKRVNDLATSTLIQRGLEVYISVGRYHAHVRRSSQVYRKRRDALVAAIQRYLPAGVHLVVPQGGLFVWARLPDGMSAARLLTLARAAGVEYAPGARFFVQTADGESYMRLNFATQTVEDIGEGVRRLGQAFNQLSQQR
ncbi:MAG: PLP-dependent aminotransferase family protein [Chloroflexi bacterium]|nr:PLP-dependent aminotransferase family protein [Chloroflexota bacterium]